MTPPPVEEYRAARRGRQPGPRSRLQM